MFQICHPRVRKKAGKAEFQMPSQSDLTREYKIPQLKPLRRYITDAIP
jgi:hypothetical protein